MINIMKIPIQLIPIRKRVVNFQEMFFRALLLLLLPFRFCTCRDTIRGNEEPLKDGDYLLSKESNFEMGFFSPGNSNYRYVGIWYSQTRVPGRTVVWVANRNKPINDTSGVLKINRFGELALYAYNMESIPIWSTNLSSSVQNVNKSTISAQILDTGNFVVFQDDPSEVYTWQSFDYPTDTLLPGMKIGINWKTGQKWELTSWKSQDDPGIGNYTFRLVAIQTFNPEFFIYRGLSKYWRSDPGPSPKVFITQDETYFYVNETNPFTRMTLIDSALQRLTWDDDTRQWEVYYAGTKSRCDLYGQCGANSKCSPNSVNLYECDCLPGYEPKSINEWYQNNGSGGCVSSRIGESKCGNGDGFVKVARVKYPDTSVAGRLRTGMFDKECMKDCLNNCSCTGYMSIEDEFRGGKVNCLTWYGNLMDILEYTAERDLYVRVNATILAANAGKSQGFLERRGMLVISILSVLLAVVLIISLACWYRKKKRNTKGKALEVDELDETQRHSELQFFDLDTLVAATDNFSHVNELGHGGFGSVYKGQLPNEQDVAVKRLSKTSGQGVEEFKNEVALIARLQHRNLVKLLGCCIRGEERMLILEFMPNKSLDFFLFDHTRRSLLDWGKRFEIMNGIARGVLYLHQDLRLRIIHRDLKTSNVLLDSAMNPKISDFGMARIFHGDQQNDKTNRIVGTYGYMSPEYAVFGRYSMKSDVFSYGVILLEIVTGKKNCGSYVEDDSMSLIGHVWELWRENRALNIVDSTLKSSYEPDEVIRCIQIALLCVQQDSKDRPTISDVVFMLSGEVSPSIPKQPAFVYRRMSDDDPLLPEELLSTNDLTLSLVEAR